MIQYSPRNSILKIYGWACGKAGNGNQIETGNRNWKGKWEMETNDSWVQCALSLLLYSSNGHMTGFMSLSSCIMLCDFWLALLWWAMSQSSLVHVHVRGSGHKTSCKLTISLGLGTRPAFLLLEPHSQTFSHLHFWLLAVCEANDVMLYFTQATGTIALFPTIEASSIRKYRNIGAGKGLGTRLG